MPAISSACALSGYPSPRTRCPSVGMRLDPPPPASHPPLPPSRPQVPGLPEEHSVGQPTWCPPQPPTTTTNATDATTTTCTGGGPSGLVVVAWPHAAPPSFPRLAAAAGPRKLGVVFCYNRSAHLYHVPMTRGADGCVRGGRGTRAAGQDVPWVAVANWRTLVKNGLAHLDRHRHQLLLPAAWAHSRFVGSNGATAVYAEGVTPTRMPVLSLCSPAARCSSGAPRGAWLPPWTRR